MDKHIPTNNKITDDKQSQQLLPKQVATQPSLLNQTNRISLPLLNCRPRPTLDTFLISCPTGVSTCYEFETIVILSEPTDLTNRYRITVSSLLKQLIYTNYPRDSESKFSSVLVASIFEFGYDHSLCSLYYQSNEKKKNLPTSKVCFVCSRVSVRILNVNKDTYNKILSFDDFDCFSACDRLFTSSSM